MLGPKNKDLKSISDFNSTWADRVALLILGGLVVDIVEVFILGKVWPEWALTIAANSLIAIGVWGELRFAKRARDADDSRVAEALERAARLGSGLITSSTGRRRGRRRRGSFERDGRIVWQSGGSP